MNLYNFAVLTGPEWAELWHQMPEKGPYEAGATKPQKNRLWKMGLDDPAFLDGLGLEQASWLISAAETTARKNPNNSIGCFKLILAFISVFALLCAIGTYLNKPPAKTPVATPPPGR